MMTIRYAPLLVAAAVTLGSAGNAVAGDQPALEVTPEHPLYVERVGAFVKASDLRAGDVLRMSDGSSAVVSAVEHRDAPAGRPFEVYNFEVEGLHTYFVAPKTSPPSAPAVWVHNTACPWNLPGEVTGGSSTVLDKNIIEDMGYARSTPWSGYQAHHLIPSQVRNRAVIKRIGMHLDHHSNGIRLRRNDDLSSAMSRHQGFHGPYNEAVAQVIDLLDASLPPAVLRAQIRQIQDKAARALRAGMPMYISPLDSVWMKMSPAMRQAGHDRLVARWVELLQ